MNCPGCQERGKIRVINTVADKTVLLICDGCSSVFTATEEDVLRQSNPPMNFSIWYTTTYGKMDKQKLADLPLIENFRKSSQK